MLLLYAGPDEFGMCPVVLPGDNWFTKSGAFSASELFQNN